MEFRSGRVLLSTLAFVAAIAVMLFAIQDWWTHVKYIQMGWSVTTGQGWWRLTSAIAETVLTGVLVWLGARLLAKEPVPGRSLIRRSLAS